MTDRDTLLLRRIQAVSISIGMEAEWVICDLNRLVNRPGWQTKAEAELENAEQQLTRALSVVQQARALYRKLQPLQAAE